MTHLKKTLLFFLFFLFISSCSIPKKIKYDDIEKEDVTISTPRNIITAVLTNRGKNSEIPNITVGKFIELADRYQSCQCKHGQRHNTRAPEKHHQKGTRLSCLSHGGDDIENDRWTRNRKCAIH